LPVDTLDKFFIECKKSILSDKELNIYGPCATGQPLRKVEGVPNIFVDGGSRYKKGNAGIIVGDGDSSFDTKMDICLNPVKAFSDLSFVLNSIPVSFKLINMFGFLGERRDHELINLAVIHRFLRERASVTKVVLEDKVIAYSVGEWTEKIEGVFSLFSFSQVDLELSGACQYSITKEESFIELSSQGLSNIGKGIVNINTSGPLFLFN
jgi:thiamine pyrophosphokinase